jgi:hypothetical protein
MNASLFEGTAIITPRLQRFGREKPAPYAVLALDTDQSRPDAASYVVKRKRGHRYASPTVGSATLAAAYTAILP